MTDVFPRRFAVEVPTAWLLNEDDGRRHRPFFARLMGVLGEYGLPIDCVPMKYGDDFKERQCDAGAILFSWHSIGPARPNVWRLKEAAIPPFYSFDRRGYAGFSEAATNASRASATVAIATALQAVGAAKDRLASNVSKYQQPESHEGQDDRGYVFLPMQVTTDTVARHAYLDTVTLAREAAKVSRETGVRLIVKRHPLCQSQEVAELLAELTTDHPTVKTTTASVRDLIFNARSVLTVNSGVGMEALIAGKPVYASGKSEWISAATGAVKTVHGIADAFRETQPHQSWEATRVLGWYLTQEWVDGSSSESIRQRVRRCISRSSSCESPLSLPSAEPEPASAQAPA